MHSIPNYGNATKDKDRFAKFPAKHHDKHPTYAFNEKNFPTLKPAPSSATNTPNTNRTAADQTNAETSSVTTDTNAATTKKPFDLKALQAQVEKNLKLDFTKLLNAKMEDFHADIKGIKGTLENIGRNHNELSLAVTLLQKQHQHIYETLQNLQNKFQNPSPSRGGDGRT